MSEYEMGPQGRRRARGARERILVAAAELFREQGINSTGMDQLCSVANVSKRTAYQYFGSKDELITEYVRRLDSDEAPLERADLTPRERLLAIFETLRAPERAMLGCPLLNTAAEIADPAHPARALARAQKLTFAARLANTAREAGAQDPELLGEQLALLYDGAAARSQTLGSDTTATAAVIAAALIDQAIGCTASARAAVEELSPLLRFPPDAEAEEAEPITHVRDLGDRGDQPPGAGMI